MRMTAIHAQTKRKRQDRSARCAEKHHRRDRIRRFRGRSALFQRLACAPDDAARDGKCLSSGWIQAIFTSDGITLGVSAVLTPPSR